jgi:hypothetical protein
MKIHKKLKTISKLYFRKCMELFNKFKWETKIQNWQKVQQEIIGLKNNFQLFLKLFNLALQKKKI